MKETLANQIADISRLATCNPFAPARFELEKKILGPKCEPLDSIAWNRNNRYLEADRPNVIELTRKTQEIVRLISESRELPDSFREHYWNVATYFLLYRHITTLPAKEIWNDSNMHRKKILGAWEAFREDYQKILDVNAEFDLSENACAHLFACLMQVHRAFFNIFDHILGESLPIAKLREQVWESIFTCCVNRYHDVMYDRMRDLSTLVTGPSGTGKELVARAIGLSQYVPFDVTTGRFEYDRNNAFLPLNLTALSPTLIESELFGHRKGAFTGAVADRIGWLETCPSTGAVFLDEIGDLDIGIQVKLLRVLQQRTYCRLGESNEKRFAGKIIAATNRNLEREIIERRFREDFYFRICTDRIETPTLRTQLNDRPEDLRWLVESIVNKQLCQNCEELADEITSWIESELGADYQWSGNIRELEQCVRGYIIRGNYTPLRCDSHESTAAHSWLQPIVSGDLTAEEVLQRYCTWMYSLHGSYEKSAQVLKLDRRTVKSKIDSELLTEFKRNK